MPAPTNETLRDLLNLLRVPTDDSAREPPDLRQDVGGPYRSERETLEAQVQGELARLEHEQALLNERRALIAAVRRASRPETFPRRFARTLALGAMLGGLTSMGALLAVLAPHFDPIAPVALNPPSAWHMPAARSAPAMSLPDPVTYHLCGNADRAMPRTWVPHTLGSATQITDTVWDVDRDIVVHSLLTGRGSLRLVHDERLGVRLYGIRRASPAGQLGLQNGDELIAVDGVLVRDLMARTRTIAAAELLAIELTSNSRVELSLVRHGEPMTFTYLLR